MAIPPPNKGEVSTSELLKWFSNVENIISVPGGQVEFSETQRRLALLLVDGTLLVDAEQQDNPQIRAVREIAKRKGFHVTSIVPVSTDVLRQFYEEAAREEQKKIASQMKPTDLLSLLLDAIHISLCESSEKNDAGKKTKF